MEENEFQFNEKKEFEKKANSVKNIFLLITFFVVLCALGGLFGYSPWNTSVNGNDKIIVQYESFLHANKPGRLKVILKDEAADFDLAISNDFFEKMNVKLIVPRPTEMLSGPGSIIFKFKGVGDAPKLINFDIEPTKAGKLAPAFSFQNNVLIINQFIYP